MTNAKSDVIVALCAALIGSVPGKAQEVESLVALCCKRRYAGLRDELYINVIPFNENLGVLFPERVWLVFPDPAAPRFL